MSLVKALAKILAKYGLKGPLKAPLLLLLYLKRSGLWMPIAFVLNVLPSIIGTIYFYIGQSIPLYIAVPTGVGAEFGGALVTVISNLNVFFAAQGISKWEALISTFSPLVSAVFMWGIFVGYAKFQEGENISKSGVWKAGAVFFGLTMVLTLTVDTYALDEDANRKSGLVYFAENWEETSNELLEHRVTKKAINETAPETELLSENLTEKYLERFNEVNASNGTG